MMYKSLAVLCDATSAAEKRCDMTTMQVRRNTEMKSRSIDGKEKRSQDKETIRDERLVVVGSHLSHASRLHAKKSGDAGENGPEPQIAPFGVQRPLACDLVSEMLLL
jgi:hypothetical protein